MFIRAIVSLRNGSASLLPHWLDHYAGLGVNRFLIGYVGNDVPSGIADACRGFNAKLVSYTMEKWTDDGQNDQHRKMLAEDDTRPEEWVLWTDLDEFHEYPAALADVLAIADRRSIEVIHGHFVDRHAPGGEFVAAQPAPSLFEQYPIQSQFTRQFLGGWTQKAMACRFRCYMYDGHHRAMGRAGVPVGRLDQYRVHHFKWRAGLIERLRWGLANDVLAATSGWGTEALKLLEHIDANGGRISVRAPATVGAKKT